MPHKLCCDWLGAYVPKFGILEPNEAGKVTHGNIRSGTKSDLLRNKCDDWIRVVAEKVLGGLITH